MFGDQTDKAEATKIVADAYAHGVNYIDTADVYTKGASETMVGEILAGQRHDWVLATKLGNPMSDRINVGHYSRSWMMQEIDASLARLKTDHVDILYMHRDYNGMNLEEPHARSGNFASLPALRYWCDIVQSDCAWRVDR
jgi:aryl-alcohol dehydrogenase-like predicted oxidoreductase